MADYARKSVLLADWPGQLSLSASAKRRYFQQLLQRRPAATVDQRVLEIDCNAAVDADTYTLRFADGSTEAMGYSFSYQRFGSQWLIVSHRSARLSPWRPAAAARPSAGSP